MINVHLVCLGFKPGAAGHKGWKMQTNPLSYGDLHLYYTYLVTNLGDLKLFRPPTISYSA